MAKLSHCLVPAKMAGLMVLTLFCTTVTGAEVTASPSAEMIQRAKTALSEFEEIAAKLEQEKEKFSRPEDAEEAYNTYFSEKSIYRTVALMGDKVFRIPLDLMSTPSEKERGFSMLKACFECTTQALQGLVQAAKPEAPPNTNLSKLHVACDKNFVPRAQQKALRNELVTLLEGGHVAQATPKPSEVTGSPPRPQQSPDLGPSLWGSEVFRPSVVNRGVGPSAQYVHVIDCEVINGRVDCSGAPAAGRQPVYRGGAGVLEVIHMTQPQPVGTRKYDESRPQPRPVYLTPADYEQWRSFDAQTETSHHDIFADAVTVCSSRRAVTYTCTMLKEYAATALLTEESGNMVCAPFTAPTTVKRKSGGLFPSGKALPSLKKTSANLKNKPPRELLPKSLRQRKETPKPAEFLDVGQIEDETQQKSAPPGPVGAAANPADAPPTTIPAEIEPEPETPPVEPPAGLTAAAAQHPTAEEFEAAGAPPPDAGDATNAAPRASTPEGAAVGEEVPREGAAPVGGGATAEQPPGATPENPQEELEKRVQEVVEEAEPLYGKAVEEAEAKITAAAAAGSATGAAAAYAVMQSAFNKITEAKNVRVGACLIMSQGRLFLEACRSRDASEIGILQSHLQPLQTAMLSALSGEWSLSQHLISFAMDVIERTLSDLSEQSITVAVRQLTAMDRLVHAVAMLKSRLATKGEDTLQNVKEQTLVESYRELPVEVFQALIEKVCDMTDRPHAYERITVVEGPQPLAPLPNGGHLGAEYVSYLRDNLMDVTTSEMQIFPGPPSGLEAPNLAQRLINWMDDAIQSKIVRKEVFKIIDLSDAAALQNFASSYWKTRHASLEHEPTGAPSFYALVSTGCRNVNQGLKNRYFNLYTSDAAFAQLARNTGNPRRQFQQKVGSLKSEGVLPQLPVQSDIALMALTDALMKLGATKGEPYGFLQLCDKQCYQQVDRKSDDVLQTVFHALDDTLMKLTAKAHRAYGLCRNFFQIGEQTSRVSFPVVQQWIQQNYNYWAASNEMRRLKKQKPVPENWKNLRADSSAEYLLNLRDVYVRFINMLKHDRITDDVMNLALHTWVSIRGVRNAAHGFKPKKTRQKLDASATVGAIFAKLWHERQTTTVSTEQHLKPFGAPLTSLLLQIAFFLHTAVEEFKMSILGKLGAVVKSFVLGLFRRNKRRTVPRTWNAVEDAAAKKPKVNLRAYQGALQTVKTLAQLFRRRFLLPLYKTQQVAGAEFLSPVVLIHALVGLWMDPSLDRFDPASPTVSPAKKLFWYHVWVNENGPSYVATKIVLGGCSKLKFLDLGRVNYVRSAAGKVDTAGSRILKLKRIPLKRSALESYLNYLQASYNDPLEIIQVALDLQQRCQGYTPTLLERTQERPTFVGRPMTFRRGFAEISAHLDSATDRRANGDDSLSADTQGTTNDWNEDEAKIEEGREQKSNFVAFAGGSREESFVQARKAQKKKPVPKDTRLSAAKDTRLSAAKDTRLSAAILGSKFSLDLWCGKYRSLFVDKISGVKVRDMESLKAQLEQFFNSVDLINVGLPAFKESWNVSVRCDWMPGFPDADRMEASRRSITDYALSKAGVRKRVKQAFKKMGSWARKRMSRAGGKVKSLWRRIRKKPAKTSRPRDWAFVNNNLETWDGRVYATHVTCNPQEMQCNRPGDPISVMTWKEGTFSAQQTETPTPGPDFVLCYKSEDTNCWATREALAHKGWSGLPIYQAGDPPGYYLSSLLPPRHRFVVNHEGVITTDSSLTLRDIYPSAEAQPLRVFHNMRIVGADGGLVYNGPPTGVIETTGGTITLAQVKDLIQQLKAANENIEVNLSVEGKSIRNVDELEKLFHERPNLVFRNISVQQSTVPQSSSSPPPS